MTSPESRLGIELFDARCIQDPYPLYKRMLSSGPVHRIGDSGFYAVCSWDAINDAVARPEDFSSNLTATMVYQPDGTVGSQTCSATWRPRALLASWTRSRRRS
jgi:cytochrome P450 family 144